MRKLIIFIIITFSLQIVNAQGLKLKDLTLFVKSDISFIHDYLDSKNWTFVQNKHNDKQTLTCWGYKFRSIDSSATGWLYVTLRKGYSNLVAFQIHKHSDYQVLLNEIKKLGITKTYVSTSEKDEIVKTYIGNKYKYEITSRDNLHLIKVIDRVSERRELVNDILELPSDTTSSN